VAGFQKLDAEQNNLLPNIHTLVSTYPYTCENDLNFAGNAIFNNVIIITITICSNNRAFAFP